MRERNYNRGIINFSKIQKRQRIKVLLQETVTRKLVNQGKKQRGDQVLLITYMKRGVIKNHELQAEAKINKG